MKKTLKNLITGITIAVLLGTSPAVLPLVVWAEDVSAASSATTSGTDASTEATDVAEEDEDSSEESAQAEGDESVEEDASADGSDAADSSATVDDAEYDEGTGQFANSWRFQDGIYVGSQSSGISLLSSSLVTWKKSSNGTITFSNGIKTTGATKIGIDVSAWQETINWSKVKAAGVDFAIIRCGYGGNRTSQDDKYFLKNVEGCQKYGIPFGLYLYSYATDTSDAKTELAHVLRLLDEAGLEPSDLEYPIYLDLEDDSLPSNKTTLLNIAKTFCNGIEDEGYRAGVYANLNWWSNYLTSSTYDQWERWVAQYNTSCSYSGDYSIWQCTSSGSVSGISGGVDMNLQYQDIGIGQLVTNSNGIRFKYNDGTYAQSEWVTYNGKTYYFGDDTYAYKNAHWIDGKYYYFNGTTGAQYTGWITWKSDGRRSYFSPEYNGAAAKGWWTISGKRYYFDPDTRHTLANAKWVNGKYYYFNSSTGAVVTGWITWKSDGRRSYFSPEYNGAAAKGWWTISGKRYYFDPDTRKAASGKTVINGNTYYFLPTNNTMLVGWYRWSDGRYSYFGGNGVWRFGTVKVTMPNGNDVQVSRTFNFGTSGKVSSSLVAVRMLSEANTRTSSTNYMVVVDTTNNWLGVCVRDGYGWKLSHLWHCSTGSLDSHATPSGTYTAGYKGYVFGHGYSCYYYTQIVNQVLIHSTKYYEGTMVSMDSRLGMHISNGCVRLSINNAKWIYNNIPTGTTIRVYRP